MAWRLAKVASSSSGGGNATSPCSLLQARITCSWASSHCFT